MQENNELDERWFLYEHHQVGLVGLIYSRWLERFNFFSMIKLDVHDDDAAHK